MIASPQNEKLKLVRKLRERKHREREGLFVTEGEDLVEAGLAAGARAALPADCGRQRPRRARRSSRTCSAAVSSLGSGTRAIAVWAQRWSALAGPPCVYLHGVGDPGNVGADRPHRPRPARAARSCSGPVAPIPTRPRRCGRAWARSSASRWRGRRWGRRRRRGPRSSPTAARASAALDSGGDALPGGRAGGSAARGARRVRGRG